MTSSLFIWLAAVAVACSSYVAIKAADCDCNPWVLDYYPRFVVALLVHPSVRGRL
jgi:hypothetical protein